MSELKLSSPCRNTISDSHADCHAEMCECFCHNGIPPVCDCVFEYDSPPDPERTYTRAQVKEIIEQIAVRVGKYELDGSETAHQFVSEIAKLIRETGI